MIRHYIIYEYGGIYLDLDIELIKPLNKLLMANIPCIVTMEIQYRYNLVFKIL